MSLEFVARAALAHISIQLLADASNWRNLTYALGKPLTKKKFSPSSIPTVEVFNRLSELVDTFTPEIAGFCNQHVGRRNAELHTGELAFAGLGTSAWLGRYFQASKILLQSMGKELNDLFADAKAAQGMIDSLEDQAAKAVDKDVKAHAQVWKNKNGDEKQLAVEKASIWADRHNGHRVTCPACASAALVRGDPSGAVSTEVKVDEVIQKQTMVPSSFECVACGLRISGLSKLHACGLGDAFTATSRFSAADFFGLYTEDDLDEARGERGAWEEDFNE